jgi:hypothetical protein
MADFKEQNMIIKYFKLGRSVTVTYKMFKLALGERALRKTDIICFCTVHCNIKGKVKESPDRPGVAQRVPGGLGSKIPCHSAHENGEVVSLTHRPPLPPGNVPGTHFH